MRRKSAGRKPRIPHLLVGFVGPSEPNWRASPGTAWCQFQRSPAGSTLGPNPASVSNRVLWERRRSGTNAVRGLPVGAPLLDTQSAVHARQWNRPDVSVSEPSPGGEGGIRTHGAREGSTVFETARFNHSRTSPQALPQYIPPLAARYQNSRACRCTRCPCSRIALSQPSLGIEPPSSTDRSSSSSARPLGAASATETAGLARQNR